MNKLPIFVNHDERYGDPVIVTVSDYRELNPDGDFCISGDNITEGGKPVAHKATGEELDNLEKLGYIQS